MTLEQIVFQEAARAGCRQACKAVRDFRKSLVFHDVLIGCDMDMIARSRDLIVRSRGQYLGSVEAPDRERAVAVAVKLFDLDDDQRSRLLIRERVKRNHAFLADRLADDSESSIVRLLSMAIASSSFGSISTY